MFSQLMNVGGMHVPDFFVVYPHKDFTSSHEVSLASGK